MLKLDVRDGGVYVADADAEPDPTEFGRVAKLLAAYDDEEEEAVDGACALRVPCASTPLLLHAPADTLSPDGHVHWLSHC